MDKTTELNEVDTLAVFLEELDRYGQYHDTQMGTKHGNVWILSDKRFNQIKEQAEQRGIEKAFKIGCRLQFKYYIERDPDHVPRNFKKDFRKKLKLKHRDE